MYVLRSFTGTAGEFSSSANSIEPIGILPADQHTVLAEEVLYILNRHNVTMDSCSHINHMNHAALSLGCTAILWTVKVQQTEHDNW